MCLFSVFIFRLVFVIDYRGVPNRPPKLESTEQQREQVSWSVIPEEWTDNSAHNCDPQSEVWTEMLYTSAVLGK